MNVMYIGLGRIGLPQALVSADAGHMVYGVDNSIDNITLLSEAKTPFYEPLMDELLQKHINNNFTIFNEIKMAPKKVDLLFFTLGTGIPVYPEKLDLSEIESLLDEVIKSISAKAYIFRTTLPVGTVDALSERYQNTNFAFVPERLVEGNAIAEERQLPKIIGTYNDYSFNLISKFFISIGGDIIRVKNPRTAEFCKLTDNSYRNLIFSFSNDIAIAAETNKIDVYEVISSVNNGYERNNIMTPGPVSGYCLGKDPYIFEYSFPDNISKNHSVIYKARKNNDYLYKYFSKKAAELTPQIISILGVSFKADIDDFRMSHTHNIIEEIESELPGCIIKIYDPFISSNKYTNQYNENKSVLTINDINDTNLFETDLLMILTPHKEIKNIDRKLLFDLLEIKEPAIFDAWNVWSDLTEKYEKYSSFGRGS